MDQHGGIFSDIPLLSANYLLNQKIEVVTSCPVLWRQGHPWRSWAMMSAREKGDAEGCVTQSWFAVTML